MIHCTWCACEFCAILFWGLFAGAIASVRLSLSLWTYNDFGYFCSSVPSTYALVNGWVVCLFICGSKARAKIMYGVFVEEEQHADGETTWWYCRFKKFVGFNQYAYTAGATLECVSITINFCAIFKEWARWLIVYTSNTRNVILKLNYVRTTKCHTTKLIRFRN